ncbi:MAG: RNA repair transcriptional activator RtcR [Acidobacteriota bacterium]
MDKVTKRTVLLGLLGPVLDRSQGATRWELWRPSVAACQHEDLLVDRFELLYQRRYEKLAKVVAQDVGSVSPETQVRLHMVDFENPWDFVEVYGVLHDFAKHYVFDPDREEYLIHITTGTHVAQICMFLLTESRYFPAKLIQTSPPKRPEKGGPGEYSIIDLDLSKYDQIAMRFRMEARDDISILKSGIETRNRAFNALMEQIEHVAVSSSDPILLTGQTGAGKSHLARRIFEVKKVRRKPEGEFVEVNCATIRGDAAMSALFGHKRGSFTGAVQDRAGLLRAADRGMLFLDEVGELGPDEQAMLLRAVEEKRFLPVGADREAESRFQLICGSNRDLQAEVARGRFREDLLARIDLWTFRLPGLRERPEDIEPNLRYELDRFAERNGARVTFNKEALGRFLEFATSPEASWTANFRDLNGAVARMATLAPGGRITPGVVETEIVRLRRSWRSIEPPSGDSILTDVLGPKRASQIDLFDQVQLCEVLRLCRRSRTLSEAGRSLFNVSRHKKRSVNDADRLRKYLERFGLSWEDVTFDRGA